MTIYQAHKKAVSLLTKAYPLGCGKKWCVEIEHFSAHDTWTPLSATFEWGTDNSTVINETNPEKFIALLVEYIEQNPAPKKEDEQ